MRSEDLRADLNTRQSVHSGKCHLTLDHFGKGGHVSTTGWPKIGGGLNSGATAVNLLIISLSIMNLYDVLKYI